MTLNFQRSAVVPKDLADHAADQAFVFFFRFGFSCTCRIWNKFVQHGASGELAVADRGNQILLVSTNAIVTGNGRVPLGRNLFQTDLILAGFFFQHFPADFHGALALVNQKPMLNFVPSARRLDESQPVATGLVSRLSDDLDDVAVAQLVPKWDDASIDLGAYTGITDFGVDVIGKVDAGCVARKDYNFPFRSEGIDLFRVEVDLERGKKFIWIGNIALPLHHLPQPGETLFVFGVDRRAVFVLPVGSDAVLGHLVHLFCANLHFKLHAAFRHDRGVQRLI